MQIRVLIAEPDRPLVETYERFLSKQGFQVLSAGSGPECVRLLQQSPPDVVLLETDLADGWGPRLLQWMQEGQIPAVPVIVLSRRDEPLAAPQIRASFNKPTSLSLVAAKIRELLSDNGAPDASS